MTRAPDDRPAPGVNSAPATIFPSARCNVGGTVARGPPPRATSGAQATGARPTSGLTPQGVGPHARPLGTRLKRSVIECVILTGPTLFGPLSTRWRLADRHGSRAARDFHGFLCVLRGGRGGKSSGPQGLTPEGSGAHERIARPRSGLPREARGPPEGGGPGATVSITTDLRESRRRPFCATHALQK